MLTQCDPGQSSETMWELSWVDPLHIIVISSADLQSLYSQLLYLHQFHQAPGQKSISLASIFTLCGLPDVFTLPVLWWPSPSRTWPRRQNSELWATMRWLTWWRLMSGLVKTRLGRKQTECVSLTYYQLSDTSRQLPSRNPSSLCGLEIRIIVVEERGERTDNINHHLPTTHYTISLPTGKLWPISHSDHSP